jgi:hypothetical protein
LARSKRRLEPADGGGASAGAGVGEGAAAGAFGPLWCFGGFAGAAGAAEAAWCRGLRRFARGTRAIGSAFRSSAISAWAVTQTGVCARDAE